MTPEELKERLDTFAVGIVVLCRTIRTRPGALAIADQLSDAGTAASSNYHSACRARSRREFIAKLGVAVEEAEEAASWMKLCLRAGITTELEAGMLYNEGRQLLAIPGASRSTAVKNYERDTGRPIDAARRREARRER